MENINNPTWSTTFGKCYFNDEAGEWWWTDPDHKVSVLLEKEMG